MWGPSLAVQLIHKALVFWVEGLVFGSRVLISGF